MRTLLTKFGLVYGDLIKIKIVAVNERGDSLPSEVNGIQPIVEDVPRKMQAVIQGYETTNTVIHLQWLEPEQGGSQILGYIVYYKLVGDSIYEELVGEVSGYNQLEYSITHGVIEGASY